MSLHILATSCASTLPPSPANETINDSPRRPDCIGATEWLASIPTIPYGTAGIIHCWLGRWQCRLTVYAPYHCDTSKYLMSLPFQEEPRSRLPFTASCRELTRPQGAENSSKLIKTYFVVKAPVSSPTWITQASCPSSLGRRVI